MLKKFALFLAVAVLLSSTGTARAVSSRTKGLTMLVVPARHSVLQVSFDLLKKRDAVLLSYQGDAGTANPLLHAWNGREWIYVPLESYETASFLQVTPSQIVLVGDESTMPTVLIEASSWSPLVMNIPSVDTATLVNFFGKLFAFRRSDWRWFATRYNLDLEDLNEQRRKTSWYDQSNVRSRKNTYVYEVDEDVVRPAEIRYEGETHLDAGTPSVVVEPPPYKESPMALPEAAPAERMEPVDAEEIKPAVVVDPATEPAAP